MLIAYVAFLILAALFAFGACRRSGSADELEQHAYDAGAYRPRALPIDLPDDFALFHSQETAR